MAGYFKDIWVGVTTVLIGMKITLGHWFKRYKAVTIQYPHETLEMNERTRARLFNVAEDCAVCLACQRACPVGIFDIKGIRAGKDEDLGMLPNGKPKRMHLVKFDIDFSKCVYCGLCVEVCETASLDWRAPQEDCTFTREEMNKTFVTLSREEIERLEAEDAARKKAKAAAKKAGAKPGGKPGAKPGAKPAGKPVPKTESKPTSETKDKVVEKSDSPTEGSPKKEAKTTDSGKDPEEKPEVDVKEKAEEKPDEDKKDSAEKPEQKKETENREEKS